MKHFFITINFQNKKANTFTLLIILIVKSLRIELYVAQIAQICRNKRAITPKYYNFSETNFIEEAKVEDTEDSDCKKEDII